MKNNILIFFIFLILVNSVNAELCGTTIEKNGVKEKLVQYCSINSGVPYQIFSVPKCEGQIVAKIRTKLSNEGFYLNEFIRQDEKIWTATCRKDMPILLMTNNKTTNEFDIVLEYYEEKKLNSGDEEKDELHNSIYKRTKTFSNIRVNYKVEEPNIQLFNLEDMGNSLYFIFGLIIIIIIVLLIGGFYVWKTFFHDTSNDIAGERKATKTLDMELNDILEDIEK